MAYDASTNRNRAWELLNFAEDYSGAVAACETLSMFPQKRDGGRHQRQYLLSAHRQGARAGPGLRLVAAGGRQHLGHRMAGLPPRRGPFAGAQSRRRLLAELQYSAGRHDSGFAVLPRRPAGIPVLQRRLRPGPGRLDQPARRPRHRTAQRGQRRQHRRGAGLGGRCATLRLPALARSAGRRRRAGERRIKRNARLGWPDHQGQQRGAEILLLAQRAE